LQDFGFFVKKQPGEINARWRAWHRHRYSGHHRTIITDFAGSVLAQAIAGTFERCNTPIPANLTAFRRIRSTRGKAGTVKGIHSPVEAGWCAQRIR